jgi:hypothetical protein
VVLDRFEVSEHLVGEMGEGSRDHDSGGELVLRPIDQESAILGRECVFEAPVVSPATPPAFPSTSVTGRMRSCEMADGFPALA